MSPRSKATTAAPGPPLTWEQRVELINAREVQAPPEPPANRLPATTPSEAEAWNQQPSQTTGAAAKTAIAHHNAPDPKPLSLLERMAAAWDRLTPGDSSMSEQFYDNGSGAPPLLMLLAPVGEVRTSPDPTQPPAVGALPVSPNDPLGAQQALLLPPDGLDGSAWDVVANAADTLSELGEFLEETDANPTLRSAATLRSLDRFRDALDRLPADADLNQTVELRVQDVALVARSMLSRLR